MLKISYILFMVFSISSLMAMEDVRFYSQGTTSLSNFSSQPEEFIQIDEILRKKREVASNYHDISKERFEKYELNGSGDVSRTNYTYLPCFLCCPCCWPCLLIAYGIRHCCPTRSCAEYDRLTKEMDLLQVEAENYEKEAKELMMKTYDRTGQQHPEMVHGMLSVGGALEKFEDGVIKCSVQ